MRGWKPGKRRAIGWPLGERPGSIPSPNAREPVDGARIRGHGDARGHDTVGRTRHDAAARDAGRAGTRSAFAADRDGSHRAGVAAAAAACVPAGSSPRSTSTPASCARASRSTSTMARTSTANSSRGDCWPARSSASAGCAANTRCGATSRTNTSKTRLAIDLINGSPLLREWVDDPAATPADLDALARRDEREWEEERADSCCIASRDSSDRSPRVHPGAARLP